MYRECLECEKLGVSCDGPNFVAMTTHELMEWCKKRKARLNYTNSDLSEKSGIPKGTIDRVFAAEDVDCKYETLRPILKALVGGEYTHNPCPDPNTGITVEQLEALQHENADIRAENIRLTNNEETLNQQITELKDELKSREKVFREDRAEYVTEQDKKINYVKDQCVRLRKTAIIMTGLLIFVLFGIIAFLICDVINPNVGWLRG